ncbi:hypothetical protein BDN70DRAFT_958174 [Pholiota conissans]|uniref:Protein CPL1-like domain-containing protein n=1 Tax=Pholiota conissans TaxID=109636 RepID=A0A9P5ZB74_9AGAR|nr:hypothetical protein BDN70DRAFT_958174 [Pholiota conissans]
MRASLVNLAVFVSSFALLGAAQSSDVCGEVSAVLKLPSLAPPHKVITYGTISECICISHISNYVGSTSLTVSAVASAGRSAVINAITQMVNDCKKQTCHYPPHSIPACQHGNPCGFTCTDGFTPFPYGNHPTTCVCNKPYALCNGKCGLFKACPSGRPVYKRDLPGGLDQCPQGLTSCPVPGRGAHSMECVNTKTDLESCGGCTLPSYHGHIPEGIDCTAIHGVSDVSCLRGQCVVHRCMSGYTPNNLRDSCVRSDDDSEIVLAND